MLKEFPLQEVLELACAAQRFNKDYLKTTESVFDDFDFDFDVDFDKPHESSLHHIFELCSVLHKNTKPGTIIAIDDNKEGKGKGQYIAQYFDKIGVTKVYDGYQLIYQL